MPATHKTDQIRGEYDVVVAGGGPAGTTAATIVARSGHSVLLLERAKFPRFKIGESLIPATFPILERLGMIEHLRGSNFTKKYSVQFFSAGGRASAPFYFSETENEEQSQTWQVSRDELDAAMFDNARRSGVSAHQGIGVRKVLFDGSRATGVRLRLAGGEMRDVRCRVVVDATGQKALIGRQLDLRTSDPHLRKAAVFTRFQGAARDSGIDEGATLIMRTADNNSWFWYIPLADDEVSVGVVGDVDYLIRGRRGDPRGIFDQELAICPALIPRLRNARRILEVKTLNEISYLNKQSTGDGWLLCGDAFGFLDPIYSSGVLLALRSAELAADTVVAALDENDTSSERLGVFAPRVLAGMAAFRELVYAFYDKDFSFGRFVRMFPEHRQAIVRILVGDVFDRDFSVLYRDIATMIPLPGRRAVA